MSYRLPERIDGTRTGNFEACGLPMKQSESGCGVQDL